MTSFFAQHLLEELIAPDAAKFNTAEIPDMTQVHDQQRHWTSNFFLNAALRARWSPPLMAYATAFLRRAEGAFTMHDLARTATISLLRAPQIRPSPYATALLYWEGFLSQAAQAQNVIKQLIRNTGDPNFMIYKPDDGSIEQRLHSIYNSIKHVEKRISAPGQLPTGSVSPVWMTNDGICSTEHCLTWAETGEILDEIAKFADDIQDPATLAERAGTQHTTG